MADLYNAIVTDEVEYRPTMSEIARNLITQVGRHSADQNSFSILKLAIIYIQRELIQLPQC